MGNKSLSNKGPLEILKARKNFLLEKQGLTKDPAELKKIKKQLQEVEDLLSKLTEPKTQRRKKK